MGEIRDIYNDLFGQQYQGQQNLIENLSSESDESQHENFRVIFHWSEAPNPKVEINKKMYSVTRVSKKGNLSLRCASSHKKIKGLITSL